MNWLALKLCEQLYETKSCLKPFRVPGVYLGSAFLRFFSVLLLPGINNLRVFNVAFSSIPTALPTIPFALNDLAISRGGKRRQ